MASPAALERKQAYHLRELEIARDPEDPGHVSPPVVAPDKVILDLGCGAGQTLIAAYAGQRAVGIDLDLDALKFGRELGCGAPLICGRAEALPFRDNCFDLVIARSSLQYTDLKRSLPEIRRVLTPGGEAWMLVDSFGAVWNIRKGWHLKAWLHFLYVVVNSVMFRAMGRQIPLIKGRYEIFHTKKSLRTVLDSEGFSDIRIEPLFRSWSPNKDSSSVQSCKSSRIWVAHVKAS
jgi:ubiquinone/menaquinone biosynthesis C-methylase UbiE